MSWVDADNIENNQTIELGWAIKTSIHAETYHAMLVQNGYNKDLTLTKYDDVILASFQTDFPELNKIVLA